jgi:hypothetical protein
VKTVLEHKIQSEILVAVSAHNCTVFRSNVGKVKTADGRWFNTGLPKGHPDLYGFKWKNGKVFYLEIKTPTGRPRKDQIRFHEMLTRHHIVHGIARSVSEALMIVDKELVGYGFKDYGGA